MEAHFLPPPHLHDNAIIETKTDGNIHQEMELDGSTQNANANAKIDTFPAIWQQQALLWLSKEGHPHPTLALSRFLNKMKDGREGKGNDGQGCDAWEAADRLDDMFRDQLRIRYRVDPPAGAKLCLSQALRNLERKFRAVEIFMSFPRNVLHAVRLSCIASHVLNNTGLSLARQDIEHMITALPGCYTMETNHQGTICWVKYCNMYPHLNSGRYLPPSAISDRHHRFVARLHAHALDEHMRYIDGLPPLPLGSHTPVGIDAATLQHLHWCNTVVNN